MRKFAKLLAAALALLMLVGIIPASAKPMEPFVPKEIAAPGAVPMMNLIEDGESGYVIVRGAQASPSEITAAEKLQEYLERISGCKLPIRTDEAFGWPSILQPTEIIVGKTSRTAADYDDLGDDGFVIKTVGESIVIAGGKRGTLYGVFDFLEKFCGCRWFSPEIVIVPEAQTVAVPAEIDIKEIPAFEYRSPVILYAYWADTDYCLANRLNSQSAGGVADEKNGGVLNYMGAGSWVHDFEENFGEHPEWFSLDNKGGRVSGDYGTPCMSNEEVIQFFIAYALANAELDCINVMLRDTSVCCQCENCKAIYEEEGTIGRIGESGATIVRLLNRMSDALDAAGSQAKLATLAYAATSEPPLKTKLSGRVIIMFAPIGSCYAHPFESCDYKGTVAQRKQLEDWVKVCGNFVQHEYTCNYDHLNLPYPIWGVLQKNVQYYHGNNFIGWYNCGDGAGGDSSFFTMSSWLYAKLLWDPYQDMDALYADFLSGYYGEGWQYVREFIRACAEEFTGQKVYGRVRHFERTAGPSNKGVLYMRRNEVKYVDDLWANAKALAKEDWQLCNIRRAEVSYRIWKSDTLRGEFSFFNTKRGENNRQLLADIWELGLTKHGFSHSYITVEQSERLKIYRLMPRYWSGRQLGYSVIGGTDNEGNDRGPGRAKSFAQLVWGWWFW